ncbi:FYN-binding protein 1 [Merluccius polli]|uniref:FYN-binding protein 1 n=1 Tax=Merluccius polli TaxID=89951 RepID=A0AA47MMW0_MERPO|nr:FYN-binding protein 1 [Merluccius polli]
MAFRFLLTALRLGFFKPVAKCKFLTTAAQRQPAGQYGEAAGEADTKPDVKAMMARFQTGQTNGGDGPGFPVARGRPKVPLHPTVSSGLPSSTSSPAPSTPPKPSLERPASGNLPSKPAFPRASSHSSSCKGARGGGGGGGGGQELAKALANRFSTPQEVSTPFPRGKEQFPIKAPLSQDAEAPLPRPKPPLFKPSVSATLPESKPAIPKPPPPVPLAAKPGVAVPSNHSGAPYKAPPTHQKPNSAVNKLWQQREEAAADSEHKHGNPQASHLPAGFSIGVFNQDAGDKAKKVQAGASAEKTNPNPSPNPNLLNTRSAAPPPMPQATKRPSFLRKGLDPHSSPKADSVGTDGAPRRNPLPNTLLLGPAPAKPSRPPRVNLDNFRRSGSAAPDPDMAPPPPASHPSTHSNSGVTPPLSVLPVAPSLPPRHPGIIEPDVDENYDDVGMLKNQPPTPPSTTGRPRLMSKQEDGSDGEMYEDLEERWEAAEKKKGKQNKDKKRLEAEKKEQKEREKKEQEARKKFKLVGPLEVMHRVKVKVDSRGGRTDLPLKKGDWVDVLRVQDNPEGKWLGRSDNGSFGYLKNDCVELDMDSLKQQLVSQPAAQQMLEQEVYDDIDNFSENNLNRVPPPSQFTAEGNSDHGAAIDEEIYDDIDSHVFPPPPPASSQPEIDPKRQKKFDKEEKEFRKKFKYDGEIRALYQVTIRPELSVKKGSGKQLPVKPGETLDVIIKAVDNKLVCRNEEGKFGTILTSYIVTE